jgi:hypothetical protein
MLIWVSGLEAQPLLPCLQASASPLSPLRAVLSPSSQWDPAVSDTVATEVTQIMPERQAFRVRSLGGLPVISTPDELDISNAGRLREALLSAGRDNATVVMDMSATTFARARGRLRPASGGSCHRASALRRLGQRHDPGVLHVRERPGSLREPPASRRSATVRASTAIISSACCTGGKSHHKTRSCTEPTGPHAASTASVTDEKERAFFLVSSLRATQVSGLSRPGQRGFFGAETGYELVCGPSIAVLCCCTILRALARDFELFL